MSTATLSRVEVFGNRPFDDEQPHQEYQLPLVDAGAMSWDVIRVARDNGAPEDYINAELMSGRMHLRNEDHYVIPAEHERWGAVLADGVSQSPHGDVASRVVSETVAATITEFYRHGIRFDATPDQPERVVRFQDMTDAEAETALRNAVNRGCRALEKELDRMLDAGETTLDRDELLKAATTLSIVMFIRPGRAAVLRIGDSRVRRVEFGERPDQQEPQPKQGKLRKMLGWLARKGAEGTSPAQPGRAWYVAETTSASHSELKSDLTGVVSALGLSGDATVDFISVKDTTTLVMYTDGLERARDKGLDTAIIPERLFVDGLRKALVLGRGNMWSVAEQMVRLPGALMRRRIAGFRPARDDRTAIVLRSRVARSSLTLAA